MTSDVLMEEYAQRVMESYPLSRPKLVKFVGRDQGEGLPRTMFEGKCCLIAFSPWLNLLRRSENLETKARTTGLDRELGALPGVYVFYFRLP